MQTGKFETLDDLLRSTFLDLLDGEGLNRVSSKKGLSTERFGALLELTNPRARISRSVGRARLFSALGELIWYLSASNSIQQIEYYIKGYSAFSDDGGKTANGAYGPRLFGRDSEPSEWKRIIDLLSRKDRQGSRNAVIQILSNSDLSKSTKDRPCTTTLQFVVRDEKLSLHAHMRSNDAYLGLPHDIFSFSMLHEIAATQLNLELGSYFHSVGSLHLYDDTDEPNDPKPTANAREYVDEKYMGVTPMPAMPKGDPWVWISKLIEVEAAYRCADLDIQLDDSAPTYWKDIACLLRAYSGIKHLRGSERLAFLDECLNQLQDESYHLFLLDRIEFFNQK